MREINNSQHVMIVNNTLHLKIHRLTYRNNIDLVFVSLLFLIIFLLFSVPEAGDKADFVHYKALYDYESENPDDLKFKAGDLIMVHPDQPHEPGWLGGELDGKNFVYFPICTNNK